MRKVLVVEDNDAFLFLIKQILQLYLPEVQVHTATTATEASVYLQDSYHLVITDYNFPAGGFPALLPQLQARLQPFLLQSSDPELVKIYDPTLQVDAISKNSGYVTKLLSTLRKLKI